LFRRGGGGWYPLAKQPHCEHFRDRGIRCHGGLSSKRQPSGTS
jgi:hypothetical protein